MQLVLLATATWGATYARFTLGPLQEAVQRALALTDNQVAWLQGPAVAVPMALGAIPIGLYVGRFARAPLFLPFITLSLLAAILASSSLHLGVLAVSRGLTGLALAAVLVSAYSLVADLYPPAARGRANTVVALGEIAGSPAAFALGGVLLVRAPGGTVPWQWALLRMALPLVAVAIAMAYLREPARRETRVEQGTLGEVWRLLWRYRRVVGPLLLGRMTVWIADGAVLVWAAPMLSRRYALTPDRIGDLLGLALLVSGLLGPIVGGALADLCERTGGPRRTVDAVAAVALCTVPAAMFAHASTPTLACVLLTTFLTGGYIIGTAAISLATIVVPSALRGLYLAVTISVCALLFIGVAPLLVSLTADALGGGNAIGRALTIVAAGTSALAFAVFILTRRYFPVSSAHPSEGDQGAFSANRNAFD